VALVVCQAREFIARSKPPTITRIVGREILDSRANPTVEADVYALVRGEEQLVARAGAPSGASTGSNEAHEMRDGDAARYGGKGVQKAAGHVSNELNAAVKGQDPRNLKKLDDALCAADGTPLKKNLGGNAITAASFALAEAGAKLSNKELYLHLASFFHAAVPSKFSLPRPMVNIVNGGKHAGGDLRIQEFMIVPAAGRTFKENLRIVTESAAR
jgi:enolase